MREVKLVEYWWVMALYAVAHTHTIGWLCSSLFQISSHEACLMDVHLTQNSWPAHWLMWPWHHLRGNCGPSTTACSIWKMLRPHLLLSSALKMKSRLWFSRTNAWEWCKTGTCRQDCIPDYQINGIPGVMKVEFGLKWPCDGVVIQLSQGHTVVAIQGHTRLKSLRENFEQDMDSLVPLTSLLTMAPVHANKTSRRGVSWAVPQS